MRSIGDAEDARYHGCHRDEDGGSRDKIHLREHPSMGSTQSKRPSGLPHTDHANNHDGTVADLPSPGGSLMRLVDDTWQVKLRAPQARMARVETCIAFYLETVSTAHETHPGSLG